MQDFKKKPVYFDIETIPADDPAIKGRVSDKLSPPANYKKPEVIAQWMKDNKDTAVRKTSLNGLYGQILCIGIAIGDEEPEILKGDELSILKRLGELLEGIENPVFIGHNIRRFDIKFIIQRQYIHGLKPLFKHTDPYYDRPITDTMEIIGVSPKEFVSLDDLCFVLGVKTPKGDLDGSKVYDYYLDGRTDEIYAYCLDDVSATRQCFKKLTQA